MKPLLKDPWIEATPGLIFRPIGAIGNDGIEREEREFSANQLRVAHEFDERLRADLTEKFNVPAEFLDLAVRIWWSGKEDG